MPTNELLAYNEYLQKELQATQEKFEVAMELIRGALIGYKVLRNLCKNADLIAGYEASVDWIKDFESFLSNRNQESQEG